MFFVAADPTDPNTPDFTSPGAGSLTLEDLSVTGGDAQGGNGVGPGGGGAGMGGAVFNQGQLTLDQVTLDQNTAVGGDSTNPAESGAAGGGIGTAATGSTGGGFGPGSFGGAPGGAGSTNGSGDGGGGGGFTPAEAGQPAPATGPGAGGGPATGLGGNGNIGGTSSKGGDGSGGGGVEFAFGGTGAAFGEGAGLGGGGGVGGGGGGQGGGGFGGGGGNGGDGGFGGGGGGGNPSGDPIGGFGGGDGGTAGNPEGPVGGGGAGMGGAIFNMLGSVTIVNSTLAGNIAVPGITEAGGTSGNGEGLGNDIFNLDGSLTLTNDTFPGINRNGGAVGNDVYSLGYYSDAGFANALVSAPEALTTVTDSIISGNGPAFIANVPKHTATSLNVGTAASEADGADLITSSSVSFTGPGTVSTTEPSLEAFGTYDGSTLETSPPNQGSPAIGASGCLQSTDELGNPRPSQRCTLGAVEVEQPPTVTIAAPASGVAFTKGQVAAADYSCDEGTNGTGLAAAGAGCQGSTPDGGPIPTGTPGQNTFTATATSTDGFTTSQTVDYIVEGVPTSTIGTPTAGQTYGLGETVDSNYVCVDGIDGPGLKAGNNGCAGTVPYGSAIDTATVGTHSFAVTATSTDGLTHTETISYAVAAPPTATITSPANGATYTAGQVLFTSYSCAEGKDGPGLAIGSIGCSAQIPDDVALDTSTPGTYELTLTATSSDGLSASTTVTYMVAAPPSATPAAPTPTITIPQTAPADTLAPAITISGSTLTCGPGTWTPAPAGYAYAWTRDGTTVLGATRATYSLGPLDQGATLACEVDASDSAGTGAPAASATLAVAAHASRGCPLATGGISGDTVGLARLGMTRTAVQRAYRHSTATHTANAERFCLTPSTVAVGYPTAKLLSAAHVRRARRPAAAKRVIWILTGAPRYALRGIRPGATLTAVEQAFPDGSSTLIGWTTWYLAPDGRFTAIIASEGGAVEQVGVAQTRFAHTARERSLLTAALS